MLLDGKVAVVTGSGVGLGRAFAIALASAGAKVVVNATTPDHVESVVGEINSNGGTAVGCPASVATTEGSSQLIQTAIDQFGRIDILVNNAGINRKKLLLDMDVADFDDVIATNLRGTFLCTREAVRHMANQKWGRIISLSSGAARGLLGYSGYAASKGGIVSMTVTWAQELADYGITCNAIRAAALTRHTVPIVEQARQAALQRSEKPPTADDLGYFAPEAAAPLVVFLCSDEAGWINGQFIAIEGPKLALWSHTRPVAIAFAAERWTVDELRARFETTVGRQLEAIGFKSNAGQRTV